MGLSNHVDVYPPAASYDDMPAPNIKWATAVKQSDPAALITGPVPGGWSGMLFSRVDFNAGRSKSPYLYWDNPVDQKAHGGVQWVPYYLQQMQAASEKPGTRLLDALEVHACITPSSLSGSAGNAAMETLRMTSTRALCDPSYKVHGRGYNDATGEYEFIRDGKFRHCGIDSFTLFKTDQGWKVATIVYTAETTGCKGH
jgi:hypothetical protein